MKAAVSPYVAFMNTYWEPDPLGEGTPVKLFDAMFRHWCLQTETFDLVKTSNSNIIQQVKKIPKWTFLKAFRPTGNDPDATGSSSRLGQRSLMKFCVAITMTWFERCRLKIRWCRLLHVSAVLGSAA